jgi:hypothetical protein
MIDEIKMSCTEECSLYVLYKEKILDSLSVLVLEAWRAVFFLQSVVHFVEFQAIL